jgi:uncharacterized protein (TIGR02466 family)
MNNPALSIEPVFATPFAVARHPQPDTLNAALRELFTARAAEGERFANAQPLVKRADTLYESNFQLFDWPDAPIAELRDFCLGQLYQTIAQLNQYDADMLRRLHLSVESWFHLTRHGGWFAMHNHALHSWSGVYCVDPGKDTSGIADSGVLSFLNPQAMSTMFMDMSVANMKGGYNYGPREFRLAPGQLIMFPSWVLHEVKPFMGEGTRITVAFNVRFKLAGATRDQVPIG